jgi:hypothetical protein
MTKRGFNINHRLFQTKSSHKVRHANEWIKTYPSPEPSLFEKTFTMSCDWIYRHIDIFFQGPLIQQQNNSNDNGLSSDKLANTAYTMIWVMNQDVTDIALKDIKYSVGWVVPGLVRQFLNHLYWKIAIYFIADVIIEEEISEPDYVKCDYIHYYRSHNKKTISSSYTLTHNINSKLLSINDWLIEFWRRLKLFFNIGHQDGKTFYLLGNFVPHEYSYLSDNSTYMIRGPDKSNFNSAFSYHKRN